MCFSLARAIAVISSNIAINAIYRWYILENLHLKLYPVYFCNKQEQACIHQKKCPVKVSSKIQHLRWQD